MIARINRRRRSNFDKSRSPQQEKKWKTKDDPAKYERQSEKPNGVEKRASDSKQEQRKEKVLVHLKAEKDAYVQQREKREVQPDVTKIESDKPKGRESNPRQAGRKGSGAGDGRSSKHRHRAILFQ
jgi:hypothetical protein